MMLRLTLRSLAAHRLRLIFTAVAVVLGVAFVAGTMIFRDTSTRSFDSLFGDLGESEVVTVRPEQSFTSTGLPPRWIPTSLLTTLREKVPDGRSFHSQIEGYAAIVRPDGSVVGAGALAQRGRAYVQRPGSDMAITSGRVPASADEVVVEEHTAAEGAVRLGDSITVVTEYATEQMTVVGIFTLGDEWLGDVTYVGFAPDVAERMLAEPGHVTAIWVEPRTGVTTERLASQVKAALPAGYEVKTGQEQAAEVREQIDGLFSLIGQLLLAFAAISVIVGSFIIFNTFTMLVAQRTRELALLRAVGASRGQVTRMVVGEAVGIGILGSTLGILAGVGVSQLLGPLVERFGTDLPEHAPVILPGTIVWSYAVGVGVTVIVAYLPARRAARVPPVAALRGDVVARPRRSMTLRVIGGTVLSLLGLAGVVGGIRQGGEDGAVTVAVGGVAVFIAVVMLGPVLSRPVIKVVGWPIARIAGAVGELSRENARRDPRRSAATAAALMIGLALVSMTTVLADSVSASAVRQFNRQFGADYMMTPQGLTGFSRDSVDRVAAVPGVRNVAAVQSGAVKVAGTEQPVTVADPAALTEAVNLDVVSGTATLMTDELLVEQTLARQRGWQVGSTVSGQYPDQATTTFRVAGVFADNEVVNASLIVSPESYRSHSTSELVQRAYVIFDEGREKQALDGVTAALRAYPNIKLSDRRAASADIRDDIDQVLNLVLVLLVLSVIIAAVGIVNTLGLSVIERTREIGLLRAVGLDRRQVRAMIRYESVMITMFGAILGLGLGVAVGWALQRAMSSAGVEVLGISVGRLAIYLVTAIAIGVVAAVWPAWRAARMNILDAIHQQ